MRMRLGAAVAGLSLAMVGCSAAGALPSPAAPTEAAPSAATASAEPAASSPTPSASTSGGGRGDYDYGTGGAASPSAPSGIENVEVGTATGTLGTWLTGPGGLTLYTFEPDSANSSTCVDDCAQAWPPFIVGADLSVEAGDGIDGELSRFERPDGTLQVAYDGAPLYYFANDAAPGDTNGQGLGDRWFVAEP